MLSASNLDVASTRRYMREATSMHFDSLQAHAGQIRISARHFALATAACGLLPPEDDGRSHGPPTESNYIQVVAQWLQRQHIADSSADAFPIGFTIRIATFDDLPFLVELETFWEHESLACNGTIRQRLEAHPLGQIVAVSADGKLLGALYSQRVPSYESLTNTTQDHELELHTSHGPVMHLLGVVTRPEAKAVGEHLHRFMLNLGRLEPSVERACMVARCCDFHLSDEVSPQQAYETHVEARTDAGLAAHMQAGAFLGDLVAGYRPSDTQNLGFGVIVSYEFRADGYSAAMARADKALRQKAKAAKLQLRLESGVDSETSSSSEDTDSGSHAHAEASGEVASASRGRQGCKSQRKMLAAILNVVSKLTSKKDVLPIDPFMEVGIDSVSVPEFVDGLFERTGLKVTPLSFLVQVEILGFSLGAKHEYDLTSDDGRSTTKAEHTALGLEVGHLHRWPGSCTLSSVDEVLRSVVMH